MNRFTKIAGGAGAVAALAIPLGWTVVPALADTTSATAAAPTTTTAPPAGAGATGTGSTGSGSTGTARAGQRRLARLRANHPALFRKIETKAGKDLAAKLGITTADLRAAVQTALQHPPTTPITDRAQRRSYWEGQLADALHIDVGSLRTAEVGVFTDGVDRRVANGRLTQAQADQLIQGFKDGDLAAVRQQLGLGTGHK